MARNNYKATNTTFINPYNFIPVDYKKKTANLMSSDEEKITGVINCSLFTKGPIAVLDTEHAKEDEKEHKSYSFLKSVDGNYMIPASSIRGMIRSVHEVITDSCFSTTKKESYITARSNTPYKPGVLMREKNLKGEDVWKLYEATRYRLKIPQNRYSNNYKPMGGGGIYPVKEKNGIKYILDDKKAIVYTGEKVTFKPVTEKRKEFAGKIEKWYENGTKKNQLLEGYLVLGEAFSRKNYESVFCTKEKKKVDAEQNQIERALKGLKESYLVYNDSAINRNLNSGKKWYGSFEKMEENGCIPIWYQYDSQNMLYFSLACIGRMAYKNTLSELINKKAACTSREELCTTCSIFGMTGEVEAYGSRVRFLDAVCENTSAKTESITLEELASPRPSYVPFYLRNKSQIQNKKREVIGYDNKNYEPRGRKFYWHFKNVKLGKSVKVTKRNSTVEILGKNMSEHFTFKIYFERMTMEEVATLVYALNFNQNQKDGNLCHKIGHGKPLGLGSVKIVVDDVLQRDFSPEAGYNLECVTNAVFEKVSAWAKKIETKNSVKALKKIADYDAVKKEDVRYPYIIVPETGRRYGENDVASHKWFSENYKMGRNRIEQELPEITDKVKTLKAYRLE